MRNHFHSRHPARRRSFLYEVRRVLTAAAPTLVRYKRHAGRGTTRLVANYAAVLD